MTNNRKTAVETHTHFARNELQLTYNGQLVRPLLLFKLNFVLLSFLFCVSLPFFHIWLSQVISSEPCQFVPTSICFAYTCTCDYIHIVVRSVSRAHFSLARSIHSHVRRSFDRRRWSHSAPSIKISIHINNTYVPFCIPQIETSQPINLFQKISIFNAINTIYIFFFFSVLLLLLWIHSFFHPVQSTTYHFACRENDCDAVDCWYWCCCRWYGGDLGRFGWLAEQAAGTYLLLVFIFAVGFMAQWMPSLELYHRHDQFCICRRFAYLILKKRAI